MLFEKSLRRAPVHRIKQAQFRLKGLEATTLCRIGQALEQVENEREDLSTNLKFQNRQN